MPNNRARSAVAVYPTYTFYIHTHEEKGSCASQERIYIYVIIHTSHTRARTWLSAATAAAARTTKTGTRGAPLLLEINAVRTISQFERATSFPLLLSFLLRHLLPRDIHTENIYARQDGRPASARAGGRRASNDTREWCIRGPLSTAYIWTYIQVSIHHRHAPKSQRAALKLSATKTKRR